MPVPDPIGDPPQLIFRQQLPKFGGG